MAEEPTKLPPKQEVALALLQTASSVYVHLDPRPDEVMVPAWFKKQPQLVLQIGLNMAVAIPDLDVGKDAISCTLSFNRTPEFCKVPYSAIYGLVGEDGRGMIWPESVPAEVASAADGRSPVASTPKARKPKLRVADGETSETPQVRPAVDPDGGNEASTEEQRGSGVSAESAGETIEEKAPAKVPSTPSSSPPAKKRRELPPYLRVVK